jgi:hypothetical protein
MSLLDVTILCLLLWLTAVLRLIKFLDLLVRIVLFIAKHVIKSCHSLVK